jgi:hypothetical protein
VTDWSAWSREAVILAKERNDRWRDRFGLADARYRWDLDRAELVFSRSSDEVFAELCLIGTIAGDTFLWSWANDTLPEAATQRVGLVRAFGCQHDLTLLTTPEFPGDRAQGLELLAISARVQGADGVFVDSTADTLLFFTLFDFRVRKSDGMS